MVISKENVLCKPYALKMNENGNDDEQQWKWRQWRRIKKSYAIKWFYNDL